MTPREQHCAPSACTTFSVTAFYTGARLSGYSTYVSELSQPASSESDLVCVRVRVKVKVRVRVTVRVKVKVKVKVNTCYCLKSERMLLRLVSLQNDQQAARVVF